MKGVERKKGKEGRKWQEEREKEGKDRKERKRSRQGRQVAIMNFGKKSTACESFKVLKFLS